MRTVAHERLRNLNPPQDVSDDRETDAVLYGQLVTVGLMAIAGLIAWALL